MILLGGKRYSSIDQHLREVLMFSFSFVSFSFVSASISQAPGDLPSCRAVSTELMDSSLYSVYSVYSCCSFTLVCTCSAGTTFFVLQGGNRLGVVHVSDAVPVADQISLLDAAPLPIEDYLFATPWYHIRLLYSLACSLRSMFSLAGLPHRRYVVDPLVSLNPVPMQLRILIGLRYVASMRLLC